MITLQDAVPGTLAAYAAAPALPERIDRPGARTANRLMRVTLFVAVFTSFIALVEPSPHDLAVLGLGFVCLLVGVRFDRAVLPLFMMLVLLNVGGLFSLFALSDNSKALQYALTSFYLAVAALVFACLLADDTVQRVRIMQTAYIAAAFIAALAGVAGYFRLVPDELFTLYGRASGTFKDPNVFAPFLILPLLFLIEPMVSQRLKLREIAITLVLLAGLFLSFSRGAWIHFAVSAFVMLTLLFLTAPSPRSRMRIVVLAGVALVGMLILVAVLTSIGSVGEMLSQRAQAVQSYDVGEGGRFKLQELAVGVLLDQPLGLGPFEFSRLYGLNQHNVYLQAFVVYGWVGGFAYAGLVLLTLFWGLRCALARTPWQPYLIAAYGAFVGEALEGFVIDTDHWRHFFLVLGMVWGLSAATARARSSRASAANGAA